MTLEELLNKLIEKGWKPFGRETRHELSSWVVYDTIDFKWKRDIRVIDRRHHHIRELVAKESWLWQFVCENGMVKDDEEIKERKYMYKEIYKSWFESAHNYRDKSKFTKNHFYEFRIIQSALCDEDKLEDFILQNVKIEW